MEDSSEQSKKAKSLIDDISCPIIYSLTCPPKTFLIFRSLLKTRSAKVCNVTEIRLIQPVKTLSLILETLLPILTDVRLLQLSKVFSPIVVTLLGMMTDVRLLQP